MFFERKKAAKRNVATRQPARFVRRNCDEQLALKGFELKSQTEQNPSCKRQPQKCTFHIL
jgi:hypothetical protein